MADYQGTEYMETSREMSLPFHMASSFGNSFRSLPISPSTCILGMGMSVYKKIQQKIFT